MNQMSRTKTLTVLAMLAALACLALFVFRISLMPGAPFLVYDPKDVVITIGGFIFGPLAAFAVAVTVCLVDMVTVSTSSVIGFVMNLVASCAFACPAAFFYKRYRRLGKSALLTLSPAFLLASGIVIHLFGAVSSLCGVLINADISRNAGALIGAGVMSPGTKWIVTGIIAIAAGTIVSALAAFFRNRDSGRIVFAIPPGAVIGLILGSASMSVVMLLWNYFLTPIFMAVPRAAVVPMLIPVFLPFNAIKAGVNAGITLMAYKPVTLALRKARLLPSPQAEGESAAKAKFNAGVALVGAFAVISCVLLILAMRGRI